MKCGVKCGSLILFVFIVSLISLTSLNAQDKQNNTMGMKQGNQKSGQAVPDWNKKVRVSPKAFVTQTIGLTDVTISYSRPGVKGRKIWGGLVPYNKVWRAGANEATKFTFGKDVNVNGHKLTTGSYSFFLIPAKGEWTVIFNKVADQWGAFEYNEAEDALRFKVKPQSHVMREWLTYNFTDMKVDTKGGVNSAVVNMVWDKLRLPITIKPVEN